MKKKILIVEDEFVEANHVQDILEQAGYQVTGIARSVNIALEMIEADPPSLIILDIFLKGSLTGIHLGNLLKEKGIAFVYLSANSNKDTLEMVKATEPYGFLVKPFRQKDLLVTIEIALYVNEQRSRLNSSKAQSKNQVRPGTQPAKKEPAFTELVGQGPKFQSVLEDVRVVAPTDTSILLLGETGTGKELIANTIHELSQRRTGPLVKINCAAIPDTLIESTLFGHEQGAFTGAVQRKRGKFEQANNGTIFLDEIGEISLDMQVKLLRALQEKEIEPLGGEEVIKVNCRIIAATNRDLEAEVAAGRFRMDLYYRLTVFPIQLPPLRERHEDIPALARYFISVYSIKMGKIEPGLSPTVIAEFLKYPWPGNIRELEHIIERAVLLNKGEMITDIELPRSTTKPPKARIKITSLEDMEREHIIEVLRKCEGRIAGKGGAAEVLNIKSSTLNSRIKKLGITKSRNIF
jgi:two-component system response regulator HydG